ncbi:MAG: transporter substrate-binding domain-containing protein [Clostridia bacterium]|nr:transporter substrate-binding domain-containing protein [Clostridia bacterium]
MKKLVAILLSLMLILAVVFSVSADALSDLQAKGKIVVGVSVGYPPYEFYYTNPESGKEEMAGFDIALAYGIGEKLGLDVEIADQTFAGLITALQAGEIDLIISGMVAKPERKEVIDFSKPYYAATQIMMMTEEKANTLKTVEDMTGKKVGAQMGALQVDILEEQFSNAEPYIIDNVNVLVLDLVQGNIDGLLLADLVAKQYITAYKDSVPLVISDVPVVYNSNGASIGVAKGDNESLIQALDAYIDEVKADGTFDSWVDTAAAQAASLLEPAE